MQPTPGDRAGTGLAGPWRSNQRTEGSTFRVTTWRSCGGGRVRPQPQGTYKASRDPLFAEKVYDIAGLYLNPPGAAVVLSIDEKSQIQALDRTQPAAPDEPDVTEKRTHDYVRHGTTSLFAALNVGTGEVTGECRPTASAPTSWPSSRSTL